MVSLSLFGGTQTSARAGSSCNSLSRFVSSLRLFVPLSLQPTRSRTTSTPPIATQPRWTCWTPVLGSTRWPTSSRSPSMCSASQHRRGRAGARPPRLWWSPRRREVTILDWIRWAEEEFALKPKWVCVEKLQKLQRCDLNYTNSSIEHSMKTAPTGLLVKLASCMKQWLTWWSISGQWYDQFNPVGTMRLCKKWCRSVILVPFPTVKSRIASNCIPKWTVLLGAIAA